MNKSGSLNGIVATIQDNFYMHDLHSVDALVAFTKGE